MTINSKSDSVRPVLEVRFARLWQQCRLASSSASPDQAWQELSKRYTEPHRLYHTLEHLDYCLQKFDDAKSLMDDADAIEMAIWYHDIINTPQAIDNEQQSQYFFERVAQDNFSQHFVEKVGDLIMITTHRGKPKTGDEQYICDVDLSSMGAPWEKFIDDSNALREESESSVEEYTLGKLKFFNALLERPRIFYSDYFYEHYENNARQNIMRYISILNQEG